MVLCINVIFTIYLLMFILIQYTIYIMQYALYNIQYTICNIHVLFINGSNGFFTINTLWSWPLLNCQGRPHDASWLALCFNISDKQRDQPRGRNGDSM